MSVHIATNSMLLNFGLFMDGLHRPVWTWAVPDKQESVLGLPSTITIIIYSHRCHRYWFYH